MPSIDLICVSGLFFELNLLGIEGINDSKCMGKEPLRFRRFRVENRRGKTVKTWGGGVGRRASQHAPKEFLNVHPWGIAPANVPKTGL